MDIPRRAALAAPLLLAAPARAQAFPSRDLRLIVPFPPGGTTDVVARLVANAMRENLDGRAITVENVAGAGGMIGAQRFVRQGDDHAMFLSQIASNAIVPALQANAGYDPERDFRALALVVTVPNVWIANPRRVPETSLAAFLARVRQGPAGVPVGSAGNGTSTHLTGELVSQLAGLRMQHVPFRGAGPAMTAVVAGDIEVLFDNLPTAVPQIRAGAVKALAVTSPARLPELPDVPTLAELGPDFGMQGVQAEAWFGLSTHKGTPDAVVAAMNRAVNAALAQPALRTALAERGTVPRGGTAEAYASLIDSELTRWACVVAEAKVTVN
jgi:tripartite-type tricarboxylate transporter receptor subunit TctC